MSEQGIVGRADLQKKDKGELQAIVAALGGKSASRDRKADLIDKVLELSGVVLPPAKSAPASAEPSVEAAPSALPFDQTAVAKESASSEQAAPTGASAKPESVEPPARAVTKREGPRSRTAAKSQRSSNSNQEAPAVSPAGQSSSTSDNRSQDNRSQDNGSQDNGSQDGGSKDSGSKDSAPNSRSARSEQPRTDRARGDQASSDREPVSRENAKRGERQSKETRQAPDQGQKRQRSRRGRGGEPPAEWETDLSGDVPKPGSVKNDTAKPDNQRGDSQRGDSQRGDAQKQGGKNSGGQNAANSGGQNGANQGGQNGNNSGGPSSQDGDDSDSGNRRRRRRGRNRDREDEVASLEPVAVSGFMELREDGYGFLRVSGWMPSKDDVYVPVRMVRQCGLRKGDHVVGTARPANRNEKNPAMENIETINGQAPAEVKNRPLFDELTPLYPSEQLRLEQTDSPDQLTSRIIDLVAPIGKGQRGLIVSPPKTGKTTLLKGIAQSIERNNPEAQLVVLLLDERPEEVTEIERSLEHGEVVASTFDRPPEEHCALAELTIERAKRLVEAGEDVVILLDGITRLVRAYNMGGPSSGRQMPGGLDIAAIYPAKRFFGSARNLEDGGSLTILATAAVETGSRMDEVIFEEFTGTGNMELRLDRNLAERDIFPAIDIAASSTRRSELLGEDGEHTKLEKLRETLGSLDGAGTSSKAGIEYLVDRLTSVPSNSDFLGEIATS